MAIPSSAITFTAKGLTEGAGFEPAEYTSTSRLCSLAKCLAYPSAIWLLAEFPVQIKAIFAI